MDNSTNNKNIFQSELPCEKKNGHSIIQEFINNYPYGVQDLIKLLECGYQITYEDRKIMKEQFPTDTYKYYATFSRLAFKLYQEGQAELITTLITSGVDLSGTIYTIEALLSNKPEYFSFQTNVWVCIANNYNPQNEMFRLLGTKRSFSQNETFFFSHPYPALFRLISHF